MMLLLFWAITAFLTLVAIGFFLPWIGSRKLAVMIVVLFSTIVYGLYTHWGSSQLLGSYYSGEDLKVHGKEAKLRRLMTEFKKQEYRLRLRLEENPEEMDAKWRLLDLLAIKALLEGNPDLARQDWEEALKKVPENLKPEFSDKLKNLKNN